MANEFTLAGTFKDANNNPLYEGRYVVFRITSVGTDLEDAVAYPRDSVSFPIDANGIFGGTLWINGDSGRDCLYEVRDPSGQRLDVVIPSSVEGTTVRYETIIELYGAGDADPQLPTNQASFNQVANNLSDVATPSTARTNLGVEIGTDVQPFNPVLSATEASFLLADETKLDGIETLADVTDTTNVTAAGAHMSGGTDVPVTDGGTGSSTASGARTNLGVPSTTEALLAASNLSDVSSATTSRTNLGVAIGSDVQAHATVLDNTTASFLIADETKLDGIEALADVTDATNVAAAGAYVAGGTDVPVVDGGTGSSTAAGARANLDLEPGVDIATNAQGTLADSATQPLDNVSTLGSGAEVSGRIPTADGVGGVSWTTASTGSGDMLSANNLNDVANVSTSRTNLGLEIGVDVQAHAANLDATTGTFLTQDQTKLDGIEALADVTDAAAVIAAGAYTVGGTDVAVLDGGTGASTESAARTSLGLEIGVDVEAADATILKDADIGSTVQAYDAILDTIETTITDTDLAVPTSGAVFDYADPKRVSEVFVTDESQLDGTLLSTVAYVLDPSLVLTGAVTITVPSTGLALRSTGAITSSLTCSANSYTMFDGGGTLVVEGISFTASGTSSKVFGLTAPGALDILAIRSCAFVGCTSVGEVTDYAIILEDTNQFISCTDGLTISGDVIVIDRMNSAITGTASGGTIFKEGTALAISRRFLMSSCTDSIDTGATLCDFQASNFTADAGFEVILNDISGAGSFFSAIDADDVKCRWRDNNFDPATTESNTYVGSRWELTTEVETVVSASATDYKVLGTTTYSDEFWFSNTTDNAAVYDSSRSINVVIQGALSVIGTNGHTIQLKIRKWDDSAAGYVDIQTVPGREMSSTGAAAAIPILAYTVLDSPSDRIELWGQNIAATGNFTLKEFSVLAITERAN